MLSAVSGAKMSHAFKNEEISQSNWLLKRARMSSKFRGVGAGTASTAMAVLDFSVSYFLFGKLSADA